MQNIKDSDKMQEGFKRALKENVNEEVHVIKCVSKVESRVAKAASLRKSGQINESNQITSTDNREEDQLELTDTMNLPT